MMPPHSCKCGGPLVEKNPGGSVNFYEVHCPLCKTVALAPKHERALYFLQTAPGIEELSLPAIDKVRRNIRNRRKRFAKKHYAT